MQVGDEFVVMVETTITANGKTIENPIIRVTRPQAGFNPRFVYFVDDQTVGQPRHWYVGDGNGNVVVSDVDVVDSTTSSALATALTNKLTAAGYLSGTHTGTVNDVPSMYTRIASCNISPSLTDLVNSHIDEVAVVRHGFNISGVTVNNPFVVVSSYYSEDDVIESINVDVVTDNDETGIMTEDGLVVVSNTSPQIIADWFAGLYEVEVNIGAGYDTRQATFEFKLT